MSVILFFKNYALFYTKIKNYTKIFLFSKN